VLSLRSRYWLNCTQPSTLAQQGEASLSLSAMKDAEDTE